MEHCLRPYEKNVDTVTQAVKRKYTLWREDKVSITQIRSLKWILSTMPSKGIDLTDALG